MNAVVRCGKPVTRREASAARVVAFVVTFALHAALLLALTRPHPPSPLPPPQQMQVVRIDVADAMPVPPEPVPATAGVAPSPPAPARPRTVPRVPKVQTAAPAPPPAVAVRDRAPASPQPAAPEHASPTSEPPAPAAETASSREDAANAAAAGNAASVRALDWQSRVLAHLERYRRYPFAAQRAQQQGTAWLRFTVDRRGHVLAVRLDRGSGVEALDEESLAVVQRAQPLPPPPDELGGAPVEVVLPLQFRLRRR